MPLPGSDFTVAGNDSIYSGDSVHGTGCAEIVYDVAPGAELYLLKVSDRVDLENAKDFALRQGIDIMSSSLSWPGTGWGDGQGLACEVANDAVLNGMLWANSAGNYAQQQYTALWADSDGDGWHNVSGDAEVVELENVNVGDEIVASLTWNDWPASSQDYDLYLYHENTDGNLEVVASGMDAQLNSAPVEYVSHDVVSAGRYMLSISKAPGARSVFMKLFSQYHRLSRVGGAIGTLGSPADAAGVVTVGALHPANYNTGPIESYSSQGPTADGRIKPDLVAPAGVATVSYGAGGFSGTSAAAPHVAAAAALLKSKRPFASMEEIRDELFQNTRDLGIAGMDNIFGRGSLVLSTPAALNTALHASTGGYWELESGRMVVDTEWRLDSQVATSTGLSVRGTYSIFWQNETPDPKRVSYHVRFVDEDDVELARFTPLITHEVEPGTDVTTTETFDVTFSSIEAANSSRMLLFASFTTPLDHIASVLVSPTALEGVPGETVNFTIRGLGIASARQLDVYMTASEEIPAVAFEQVSVPPGWFSLAPSRTSDAAPSYRISSAILGSDVLAGDQLLSEVFFKIPDDAAGSIVLTVTRVSVGSSSTDRTELTPGTVINITILPPPADNGAVVVALIEQVLAVPLRGDPVDLPIQATGMDRVLSADIRLVVDPPGAIDLEKTRFVTTHGSGTVSLASGPGEVVGSLGALSAVSGDAVLGTFQLYPSEGFDPSSTSIRIVDVRLGSAGGGEDVITPASAHVASFAALAEGPVSIDFDLSPADQASREIGRLGPGDIVAVQLILADGDLVTGWACAIDFDPTALKYSQQSFTPSDLIPSLFPLVAESSGSVELGGTTLGSVVEVRGGDLGELSFEVLDGFTGETELTLSEVTLRLASGGEYKAAVRHVVRISSDDFGPLLLAGDFNGDGGVDFSDFFTFADAFGGDGGGPQDMNSDGEVDFSDFFLFADAFGSEQRAKLLALAEQHIGLPSRPVLFANKPNPFNATTTIEFFTPVSGVTQLDVFDMLGRRVRQLHVENVAAGTHKAHWDGLDSEARAVASGVYLYRLTTPVGVFSRRMTLLQ